MFEKIYEMINQLSLDSTDKVDIMFLNGGAIMLQGKFDDDILAKYSNECMKNLSEEMAEFLFGVVLFHTSLHFIITDTLHLHFIAEIQDTDTNKVNTCCFCLEYPIDKIPLLTKESVLQSINQKIHASFEVMNH